MQRHKTSKVISILKQVIMSHSLVPATVFLLALSAVHAEIIDRKVGSIGEAVEYMKEVLNKNTGSLQLLRATCWSRETATLSSVLMDSG